MGDVFLIALSIKIAQWLRFGRYYDIFTAETGASLLALLCFPLTFYMFDLYRMDRITDYKNFLRRMFFAGLLASPLLGVLFYLLPQYMFGRGVFLICLLSVLLLCSAWRSLFRLVVGGRTTTKNRLLFVGHGASCRSMVELLLQQTTDYEIVGRITVDGEQKNSRCPLRLLGRVDDLITVARQTGARMVVLDHEVLRQNSLIGIMLKSRLSGISIITVSDFFEIAALKIPPREVEHDWLHFVRGLNNYADEYRVKLKYLGDIMVSVFLLLLLWPLMLLIGLAVKIDTPGKILYRQQRVGRNGRIFEILKFRSMRENMERNGAVWATENDDRITRVGHYIRACRLDELPQLFNVLKGDMSLIGPRPERPEFTKILEKELPCYGLRHVIRPGITGWAQVRYRYGASVEDSLRKLEYDLYYVKNFSFLLDIKICLKTIGTVFMGDGAR